MLNPFADVNWNPGREERRSFARSLVIGFPIVALVLLVVGRLHWHVWRPFPVWLGGIGATVGAVLWVVPQVARPFYVVWYFIACCMGFAIGNLLLALVFYVCITPIGLILRLFRPPLRKSFDRTAATYWRDAEQVHDARRYYRQF